MRSDYWDSFWDAWYLNIERRNSATAMLAMYHLLLTKGTMETIDQGDLLSMKSRETILTTLRWRTARITMMFIMCEDVYYHDFMKC